MSDLRTQSELNQVASKVDPLIGPCPKCGGQLRLEFKVEWRPMSEACAMYGVTPAEVIAAGTQTDTFGRIKAGVPYVTCMACGMHADATAEPDVSEEADRG